MTDGPSSATQDLLRIALEVAVPLWIEQLRERDPSYLLERARVCGQAIAERGDIIQFKSKTKGASGEAFDRLAEGLAAAALVVPGGITFIGLHFKAPRR